MVGLLTVQVWAQILASPQHHLLARKMVMDAMQVQGRGDTPIWWALQLLLAKGPPQKAAPPMAKHEMGWSERPPVLNQGTACIECCASRQHADMCRSYADHAKGRALTAPILLSPCCN